ncbi:glycoside hydrolase [Crepidotus variabilis]|uniref:Alpha-galactosidase n=1 Tax=Crepidotus variabilis TaxID=179855 RepID=A0A9P6JVZ8_9AGAR|nr:glycoside hydrolase [Crepidotus variabilis]
MLSLSIATLCAGLLAFNSVNGVLALSDGAARLPAMGFNSWIPYGCGVNEDNVFSNAQAIKSTGLQALGYSYVNIDDCYAQSNRNSNGDILEDATRFKSGMKTLTDKIHGLGLKAGIFADAGTLTCQGYPGSFGKETQDAKQLIATWGFDYVKYADCNPPADNTARTNVRGRFENMRNAIAQSSKAVNKKVVLSLVEFGNHSPWQWATDVGHSWRIIETDGPNWGYITSTLNRAAFITQATNFDGRNDLDMLQIGNSGLSIDEQKTHFTAWALTKSPLLIGTDLTKINSDSLNILKNKELIDINQDNQIGTSISPLHWGNKPDWTNDSNNPPQIWSGPTKDGVVFMFINTEDQTKDFSVSITDSAWISNGRKYSVRDLWAHSDAGTTSGQLTAKSVPRHGVAAFLLKDAGNA